MATIKGSDTLQNMYDMLGKLGPSFRDKVCRECDWSEPTFYRKMKENKAISNADMDKIKSILREIYLGGG